LIRAAKAPVTASWPFLGIFAADTLGSDRVPVIFTGFAKLIRLARLGIVDAVYESNCKLKLPDQIDGKAAVMIQTMLISKAIIAVFLLSMCSSFWL
jgi:hypothetical protein